MRRVIPLLRAGAPLLDWGRQFDSYSVIRRWAVGPRAHERHVDMANEMILTAPTHVLSDFYRNFVDLDLSSGLDAVGRARTTVVGGTADLLTPLKHSRRLADEIPDAKLVVLQDVGHMMMFEDHESVTKAIEDVLEDITA
ncbi:alpha/beta fold hydrolase [Aeromicrobium sp. UC242_57]|uniref:alpha/beta fold hydrolase n=1 Tax=Aeromicrobium sp. UC242_57 TaxID=3374624 RepID=UPI0037A09C7E